MDDLTRILAAIGRGERQDSESLLPLVYDELRTVAAYRLARERPGHTLEPTALVHEAFLRLVRGDDHEGWEHRGHFFAAASEAMRRILVENARRKQAEKHGGGFVRRDVEFECLAEIAPAEELLALDQALTRFEAEDPVKARLVHLRYFAGLTLEEAAQAMGISLATAKRHWAFAKAWLFREIEETKG